LISAITRHVNSNLFGSDIFAAGMKRAELLNQALGGSKAGGGVVVTIDFTKRKANAAIRYGNEEPKAITRPGFLYNAYNNPE
jgi:hypothetical protein